MMKKAIRVLSLFLVCSVLFLVGCNNTPNTSAEFAKHNELIGSTITSTNILKDTLREHSLYDERYFQKASYEDAIETIETSLAYVSYYAAMNGLIETYERVGVTTVLKYEDEIYKYIDDNGNGIILKRGQDKFVMEVHREDGIETVNFYFDDEITSYSMELVKEGKKQLMLEYFPQEEGYAMQVAIPTDENFRILQCIYTFDDTQIKSYSFFNYESSTLPQTIKNGILNTFANNQGCVKYKAQ